MSCGTYEEAIKILEVGPGSILSKVKYECPEEMKQNVKVVADLLNRVGITFDLLDKLSVIHIAGTKGKGTTGALTESILRNLNLKTGFYSSPHFMRFNETIRINGEPLSDDKLAEHFWYIYNRLQATKESENKALQYMSFWTVLAFHTFLTEKVDVAVVEVGCGGEYDFTNVLQNTKTIGITSLGFEHTNLLGDTYRDIAWHKSGIIKPDSNVFSSPQYDDPPLIFNTTVNMEFFYFYFDIS